MAACVPSVGGQGSQEDLKTHFATREGVYRLLPLTDYTKASRSTVGGGGSGGGGGGNVPSRLSFVRVTESPSSSSSGLGGRVQVDDLMCVNLHRELHVYRHDVHDKVVQIARPLEKKVYDSTFPICHDFNQYCASPNRLPLLIGLNNGQVDLLNLAAKEFKKSFNTDQMVDKSKVTCVRWVPGSESDFVVAHASGQLYVYDEALPCTTTPPVYQLHKQGLGFSIHLCKAKGPARNPKSRWLFDGILSINEVAFSPCTRYMAVVSQDGFLRVFNFQFQEVVGAMKSYFGGLRCVCWSPDSKYIVTGGEDDLVTVWSLAEKRVICRYRGHKSWVTVVAFDHYTTVLNGRTDPPGNTSDDPKSAAEFIIGDETPVLRHASGASLKADSVSGQRSNEGKLIVYRFASVGEDTQLCLWELTEDNLVPYVVRNRSSVFGNVNAPDRLTNSGSYTDGSASNSSTIENHQKLMKPTPTDLSLSSSVVSDASETLQNCDKDSLTTSDPPQTKRSYPSLSSRSSDNKLASNRQLSPKTAEEAFRLLGESACPQLHDVPMLDPLVCKKIARERLTGLAFREDSIVTLCQEGIIGSWARPGLVKNGCASDHF